MRATVFDIQRSSFHDGPGIRTTVFLKGCPLECLWCHNPESNKPDPQLFFFFDKCVLCSTCVAVCGNNVHQIRNNEHIINYNDCKLCGKCVEACPSNALKITGAEMSVDEIMEIVVADVDFYKKSNGGITVSGGEPLMQFSFLQELLKRCKEAGINTCIETSGFTSAEKFKKILPWVDTLLFDYKITNTEEHKKYTGVGNALIMENLDVAYNYGTSIFLRCPVIHGINDNDEHFKGIRTLDLKYPNLAGIGLLPYHTTGNNKRTSIGKEETLSDLKTTSPELAAKWLNRLKELNCSKAKLEWI
ncbi:MAG: glycyl-radical enzyme activating protein [Prolixibacteraceae bacterium]|nr:glycyl-radical enzyme activating protein [Prolixibacteraceae bacterium]